MISHSGLFITIFSEAFSASENQDLSQSFQIAFEKSS